MTRRTVAVLAWLLTASMTVAWAWVIAEGDYMNSMMEAVPAEQQPSLTQGWWIVAYVAMAGLLIVTLANATVGLLLASRRGGGRMGAILLVGGVAMAAVPFGFVVGGSLALRDPLDPVANALFLIGPALFAVAFSMILPVVALADRTRAWRAGDRGIARHRQTGRDRGFGVQHEPVRRRHPPGLAHRSRPPAERDRQRPDLGPWRGSRRDAIPARLGA